jgi:hypothetical protein
MHPLLQPQQILVDQSLPFSIVFVLASHLPSEQNIAATVFYAPALLSHYFRVFYRISSILASFHASSFVNIPLAFPFQFLSCGENGKIPKIT